jgi:hypothetical protein
MRWLDHLSSEHRVRLLSFVGAVVLVVLFGSAAAVWLFPGIGPHTPTQDGPRLRVGAQPGSSPTPSGSLDSPGVNVSGTSPSPTPSMARITATYKTIAVLGLGGFDTEVRVVDPTSAAWTVVLVMPADKAVENLSTGAVKMVQEGTKVTLTPTGTPGATATFIVRFPALLALGKSVTSCTINGEPCAGI